MKWLLTVLVLTRLINVCTAQVRWDGEAGDNQWENARNWEGDQLPGANSIVLLDNSLVNANYTVRLPAGAVTIALVSIRVSPAAANSIELLLPRENTAAPGLRLTDAGDALLLENGAIFRNASGATSGESITLTGLIRIQSGARYIHQTARGNATLVDHLSTAPGTERGVFEFDVPGTAGYTVSLTGNTFGTLAFRSSGSKSYSGSGASTLQIRGDLDIGTGATLTSTMTADIQVDGNLIVNGSLVLQPSTAGTTHRSLRLRAAAGYIRGSGQILCQANFRQIILAPAASYTLERNLTLPLSQHQFVISAGASCYAGNSQVSGAGTCVLGADALLSTSHPDGLSSDAPGGSLATAAIQVSADALLEFTGSGLQQSGNRMPDRIKSLRLRKPGGSLQLSRPLTITTSCILDEGLLLSSTGALLSFEGSSFTSPENAYGQRDAGWEKSYVVGPLRWQAVQNTPILLPLGSMDRYAPMLLHPATADGTYFTTTYNSEAAASGAGISIPLDRVSRVEHWLVNTEPNAGNPRARIGLSWRSESGVGNSAAALAELQIAQLVPSGNRWQAMGTNPRIDSRGTFGWIESTIETDAFTIFTLGSTGNLNTLPLRRIHLRAKPDGPAIQLEGLLEGNGQCPELVLEASTDGMHFRVMSERLIGLAYGTVYHWKDTEPAPGWNYYRLRENDTSRAAVSSPIVPIYHRKSAVSRIYPNPVRSVLTIEITGLRSEIPVLVVQADGRVCKSFVLRQERQKEDMEDLPAGRYYLLVKHPEGYRVMSFLKE